MAFIYNALKSLAIGSSSATTTQPISRIAIIGAGPSGLATAKYLVAQSFPHVTLYERQPPTASGGIWHHTPETAASPSIPQTSPTANPTDAIPGSSPPVFAGAMYDDLHANIMKTLMCFKEFPFPEDAKLLPTREIIRDYVRSYSQDIQQYIKYSHAVTKITLDTTSGRDQWHLTAHDFTTNTSITTTYDAIVIANGHYTLPFIPAIPHLADFSTAHPTIISHSKQYRSPTPFANKKVIIVGNGSSGTDIARQVSQVAQKPLYLSVRHPTAPEWLDHSHTSELPEIHDFLPATRGVRLANGQEIHDVDAVIFSTGFFFSCPFLPQFPGEAPLITSGRGIHGLYKHLFSVEHPTLAFSGLPQQAVPYPIAEAQAAVLAGVWSGKIALPPVEERRRWSEELSKEKGENLHTMGDIDGDYLNELSKWAEGKSVKEAPRWGEKELWERKIFLLVKLQFEQRGGTAMTVEELGFKFPEIPQA